MREFARGTTSTVLRRKAGKERRKHKLFDWLARAAQALGALLLLLVFLASLPWDPRARKWRAYGEY